MSLLGVTMPTGRGGRPRKEEGDANTKAVRVFPDLKEMIAWITLIKKKKSANYLDPILRAQVTADYEEIKPAVAAYKKAQAEAKKFQDETPE